MSRPKPVRILFVWLDEKRSLKKKLDTLEELLACISDAAASMKKSKGQLRRTTRDLRKRDAKCTEVDGGIFES
jgi:hypothetical protein